MFHTSTFSCQRDNITLHEDIRQRFETVNMNFHKFAYSGVQTDSRLKQQAGARSVLLNEAGSGSFLKQTHLSRVCHNEVNNNELANIKN